MQCISIPKSIYLVFPFIRECSRPLFQLGVRRMSPVMTGWGNVKPHPLQDLRVITEMESQDEMSKEINVKKEKRETLSHLHLSSVWDQLRR